MDELNSQVDSMIRESTVDNIVEIINKYDTIVEQQSSGASQ